MFSVNPYNFLREQGVTRKLSSWRVAVILFAFVFIPFALNICMLNHFILADVLFLLFLGTFVILWVGNSLIFVVINRYRSKYEHPAFIEEVKSSLTGDALTYSPLLFVNFVLSVIVLCGVGSFWLSLWTAPVFRAGLIAMLVIIVYWLIWLKVTYLKEYYKSNYPFAFLQLTGVSTLWLTVFSGVIYLIGVDQSFTWLNETWNLAITVLGRRGPSFSTMVGIDFGYLAVLITGILCGTIFGAILGIKHLKKKTATF